MPKRIPLSANRIVAALIACKGRRGDAAKRLGVSVATLRRRCQENVAIDDRVFDALDASHARADELRALMIADAYRFQLAKAAYQRLYVDNQPRPLSAEELDRFQRRLKKAKRISGIEAL